MLSPAAPLLMRENDFLLTRVKELEAEKARWDERVQELKKAKQVCRPQDSLEGLKCVLCWSWTIYAQSSLQQFLVKFFGFVFSYKKSRAKSPLLHLTSVWPVERVRSLDDQNSGPSSHFVTGRCPGGGRD